MGQRTGNATWEDAPSTATLINAARLNNMEAAIDASVATVNAGSNLSTARPTGAAIVYWRFNAGVNTGLDGANIVNAQAGDLFFVAGS